ncbi:hypothetical protein [Spirosoma areae]
MHTSFKSCLVGLALSLSLFSCIDHRLVARNHPLACGSRKWGALSTPTTVKTDWRLLQDPMGV